MFKYVFAVNTSPVAGQSLAITLHLNLEIEEGALVKVPLGEGLVLGTYDGTELRFAPGSSFVGKVIDRQPIFQASTPSGPPT